MSLINVSAPDDANQLHIVASELELVNRRSSQIATCLLTHPRLKRLLEYLELYPSHRFTTAEAAKIVYFQKNYFCSYFKRETGCTFVSWQRSWRSARIAELLLSDSISITHAAERYGYQNIRAFERAFKAVYRVSAREFRRECRTETMVHEKRLRKPVRKISQSVGS